MATELTVQSERAFQKQPHIFLNSKTKAKSSKAGQNGRRWYKDVGLGFRTPKNAIEGSYIGTNYLRSTTSTRQISTNWKRLVSNFRDGKGRLNGVRPW